MTTLSQDLQYPIYGELVTLRADEVPAARRVRWRVTGVPPQSGIEPYDERTNKVYLRQTGNGNYALLSMPDGSPVDADGIYNLEAVEEEFTSHIPHFDGDGSATLNPLEEWTEVSATAYDVYVGREMQVKLGFDPDVAYLHFHVIGETASLYGVQTEWSNELRCPVIEDPATERAKLAASSSTIAAIVAQLGGEGYIDDGWVARQDYLSGLAYFGSNPNTEIALLVDYYNQHIAATTNDVHGAADLVNVVAGADPVDLATLIARITAMQTAYDAHVTLAAPTHPSGADIGNLIGALAPATLAQCITGLNTIRAKYYAHRRATATGHSTPGDGTEDSREPVYPLSSYATLSDAITRFIALRDAYHNHLNMVAISAAYHAAADADNTVVSSTPVSDAQLIAKVNELATCLRAHMANWDSVNNAPPAVDYHASKDQNYSTFENAGKAHDRSSAISLLHRCMWAFFNHIDTYNGHGGSPPNGGRWYYLQSDLWYLHRVFVNEVTSPDTTNNPNVIPDRIFMQWAIDASPV